jgi:hypothetical protein
MTTAAVMARDNGIGVLDCLVVCRVIRVYGVVYWRNSVIGA